MKHALDERLAAYYTCYSINHEQRRAQLMHMLKTRQTTVPLRRQPAATGYAYAFKAAVALAAVLLLVVGAIFWMTTNQPAGTDQNPAVGVADSLWNAQAAWAAAIRRAGRVQSLHFLWSTPRNNQDARVEMWWQRPHDFRLEFGSTGLVMAGNSQARYSLDRQRQELKIWQNNAAGIEMFPLGQLGRLFTDEEEAVAQDWIEKSRVIKSEKIDYKGTPSLKVTCVEGGYRYEYIIDQEAAGDTQAPFYEVKIYSRPEGGFLLSHLEVLEVDTELPESLFTIEPTDQIKVNDLRNR